MFTRRQALQIGGAAALTAMFGLPRCATPGARPVIRRTDGGVIGG